ncbi:MAG: hypothetical protein Q7S76_00335 [bacterium]|nr:hypothetical protein [bacterium]
MLTKVDIDWLKSEFLPSLADAVKDKLSGQLDSISTNLDKLVGHIEDKREAQELHANQHADLEDRLHTVEERLGIKSM